MKISGYILILSLCLSFSMNLHAQGPDSLKIRALDERLQEYFLAISHESTDTQKEECDFLISSASDSLIRQHIALAAYSHYMDSAVMGAEAVAIYIFDKWFLHGGIKMKNDIDFLNAKVYADFNRDSQIGCKAPEIVLKDLSGMKTKLPSDKGRFSVLYFYDTDCASCKAQSILLRTVLEDYSFPIDFYAIYTGDDASKWKDYAEERLGYSPDAGTLTHLWDPELESDFQRKYGVLQTPKIYLIAPDGTIIGRGLDTEALLKMLQNIFRDVDLNYGGDESVKLFDGILAAEGKSASIQRVCDLADYIADATLSKGDVTMFRQLSGDLLYYLATHSGEGIKAGLSYMIDKNILGRKDIWKSQDDSLKVIGFAEIMKDLLSKSPAGSYAPDIRVPAEMAAGGKIKKGKFRLDKLKGQRNIVIFHTEGCEICASEKAAAQVLARNEASTRIYMVNVDDIMSNDPALADRLFDSFDLTSLPFIIETDRKGVIKRKYMSLQ